MARSQQNVLRLLGGIKGNTIMNPETKTLGELIASPDEQIHRNAWSILKRLIAREREGRKSNNKDIVRSPLEANK